MQKTTFKITKMDCPSEEQMIRMKLDDLTNIQSLEFDIPNRLLHVFHIDNNEQIFQRLDTFVQKPAIVSVIFSEGIFQFNKELSDKVSTMMALMQKNINALIVRGQKEGVYGKLLEADTITTIIMGSMRMVVLKWKLSGNKSNLVNDGKNVLNGLLKMLEK